MDALWMQADPVYVMSYFPAARGLGEELFEMVGLDSATEVFCRPIHGDPQEFAVRRVIGGPPVAAFEEQIARDLDCGLTSPTRVTISVSQEEPWGHDNYFKL